MRPGSLNYSPARPGPGSAVDPASRCHGRRIDRKAASCRREKRARLVERIRSEARGLRRPLCVAGSRGQARIELRFRQFVLAASCDPPFFIRRFGVGLVRRDDDDDDDDEEGLKNRYGARRLFIKTVRFADRRAPGATANEPLGTQPLTRSSVRRI
jgi:hypothetical protein